ATQDVLPPQPRLDALEEPDDRALDGGRVGDAPDGEELFAHAGQLLRKELAGTARSTTRNVTQARRELGTEREDEELEVRARFQELVILARLKQDELTGAEGKHLRAHTERGAAANHQVDFRLGVEMARPSVRGLMAPCLGPHARAHRERLEESRRRA